MKRSFILIPIFLTILICHSIYLYKSQKKPSLKIGLIHSFNGTMKESEIPLLISALLAVDEINESGGVLERQLELIVADGMSNPDIFKENGQRLLEGNKLLEFKNEENGKIQTRESASKSSPVEVIFGTWNSSSRRTLLPIIEEYKSLLMYSIQYEGVDDYKLSNKHMIYLGPCANQQLLPGVRWARFHLGESAYLVGSDYIFPRVAHLLVKDYLQNKCHGKLIGAKFINLKKDKASDFAEVINDIKKHKPNFIINTLNGMKNNKAFFAALSQIDSPPAVISFSLTENELKKINHENPDINKINNYLCWNYFSQIERHSNRSFTQRINRYASKILDSKNLPDSIHKQLAAYMKSQKLTVTDPMEATYSAVKLWAKAAENTNSSKPEAVRKALLGLTLNAPSGILYIDHQNGHAWKALRIAEFKNDKLSIIWSSRSPIKPLPYGENKEKWLTEANRIYREYGNKWELEE